MAFRFGSDVGFPGTVCAPEMGDNLEQHICFCNISSSVYGVLGRHVVLGILIMKSVHESSYELQLSPIKPSSTSSLSNSGGDHPCYIQGHPHRRPFNPTPMARVMRIRGCSAPRKEGGRGGGVVGARNLDDLHITCFSPVIARLPINFASSRYPSYLSLELPSLDYCRCTSSSRAHSQRPLQIPTSPEQCPPQPLSKLRSQTSASIQTQHTTSGSQKQNPV